MYEMIYMGNQLLLINVNTILICLHNSHFCYQYNYYSYIASQPPYLLITSHRIIHNDHEKILKAEQGENVQWWGVPDEIGKVEGG